MSKNKECAICHHTIYDEDKFYHSYGEDVCCKCFQRYPRQIIDAAITDLDSLTFYIGMITGDLFLFSHAKIIGNNITLTLRDASVPSLHIEEKSEEVTVKLNHITWCAMKDI